MDIVSQNGSIDTITLRPYQEKAISKVYAAHNKGKGTALIVLPTGTGKTEVFSKIIHDMNTPTLVLAHRKELLAQAKKKLLRYYSEDQIGIVGAGSADWNKPIIVASVQTVRNKLAQLQAKGIKLAVVDECHHTTNKNSYKRVLQALGDALILGFTATPKRLDGSDIAAIYGEPVYERDIVSMVQEQWLCDLKGILVRSTSSLDNISKRLGDYREQELAQALNVTDRNELIIHAYLTYANRRSTICFAINVEHAHMLAKAFNEQGIPAMALDGKTPKEEREWILEQFEQGNIRVLVNCEILTEGFDCPQVSCIIMARPTLSASLFMQMIGRGTRLHPGKENCIILDITDNCTRHKLKPQSFKKVLGVQSHKQEVSILEYIEDEREREQRERELAAQLERVRLEELQRAQELARIKRERYLQERRDVIFTEIDLLGNGVSWVAHPDGTITIKVAYATITIEPTLDYRYSVTAQDKYSTKVLARSVTLAQAKATAEIHASEVEARIAAKRNNTPTPKQIETLQKFRIAIPVNCTWGQASQLIGAKVATFSNARGA